MRQKHALFVHAFAVVQLLESAVADATTKQELESNLEQVRIQTLAMGNSSTSAGILPSYVAAFGLAGTHNFGIRNT